jgi:hypothetical protein
MKRALFPVVCLLLAGCTAARTPSRPAGTVRAEQTGALAFRVVHEGLNAQPCVDPPQFEVLATDADWIDVWDEETLCRRSPQVDLPGLDAEREVGVAAWWKTAPCRAARTVSVAREAGQTVVVTAASRAVKTCPAAARARGAAESFIAIRRSCLLGDRELTFRFVLDGKEAGATSWTPGRLC